MDEEAPLETMVIDRGAGTPVVVIPGVQGRWEWMAPAIDALSGRHRVLTFSLNGQSRDVEPSSVFEHWSGAIDGLLDHAGADRAAIIGVSFGGIVAARYAARHPERTTALVLVSAPSPAWRPDDQQAQYLRQPWRSVPSFALRACRRLWPEVVAAKPTPRERVQFFLEYSMRAVRYPMSPSRMADWVRAWQATDVRSDCTRIRAATLVITGEPHLDRVVPTASTLEYLDLIPGARHVTLHGTGHVGLVSKPRDFAHLVSEFIDTRERTSVHAH